MASTAAKMNRRISSAANVPLAGYGRVRAAIKWRKKLNLNLIISMRDL
jgi:hypothetical protein